MAMGILTCLLFLVALRKVTHGNKTTIAEWNLNTVVIDDYSVELEISKEGYQDWFDNIFHGQDGDYEKNISPGLSLKRHIIESVESQLTREMKQYREKKLRALSFWSFSMIRRSKVNLAPENENIYVAELIFCRNNSGIIKLLKLRG